MRNIVIAFILVLVCHNSMAQKVVQGHISNEGLPLSGVHVINLSSAKKSFSNSEGFYTIVAAPKEELQFTYMGMDTVSIIVEDVTKTLNISMILRTEQLEEVVVSKKVNKQKELGMNYFSDPSIVNSFYGYLSPNTVAYQLKVIDGSEFNVGADILEAIASRRSGMRVKTILKGGIPTKVLYMRGMGSINNSRPAIFEVDGQVFQDAPVWIDLAMVLRVGIIPGIQAVVRYGPTASGGVVIINTKSGVHGLREENSGKLYDQARLRNNFVTGKVISNQDVSEGYPEYILEMEGTTTQNETLELYHKYERQFSNVPYFYVDSYALFFEKYGGAVADKIIEANFDAFENNAVWLKALAFTYESQSRFKQAHEIYKKVYTLRPDYAQSYMDLANSYRNVNRSESANSLLARHSFLLDEGLLVSDTLHLTEMMQREIDNLNWDNTKNSNQFETGTPQNEFSTRLVFEWNDSEAEFDLQFVNPNNQYFSWKHNLLEMADRVRSEKQLGYSMVDFLLDDELPGIWNVNTTYLGNKQLTPTYLKATIYKNYGSKFQTKEIKVFRLGMKGVNQRLFSFPVTSSIVQSK
ncbi:carboxypeptidase-like regulatory domain-containing protein [Flagellimonas zhangzhouensis]|uniref:CarboxypepD_reg-like domain-containing protein n=1 Tax=Flagellimonas zhangzhouensis TaxID=1073328 RepID=A0A1H2SUI0_9FLAO|nr:carboxypeptidase-like regulatory domain-containing protein [Allomuricauda zhangzhouensis]SDQ79577.1 CarboxypepD_reg-like domain-containing protein [Allomuricauda zhangzhouensis]SDW35292.1 CarboxypepD_reg-like domain-containing protein [Allomuricauda zhangzhouensis]